MKKHTLIVTLIAGALLCNASAYDPTPTPESKGGCNHSSWNPELYSFYGAKATIVEKLAQIPTKLSERRVFLQVTQGDSSVDIRLYEREKDGSNYTVTEWTKKQTPQLIADIDKAICDNKGVNCVGEQVKGVLGKELKEGKVVNAVAAPASPEAAFSHPVKEAVGDFIKTTVIILC